MFFVNNKNTRTTLLTFSGVFIVSLEHTSHLFLVFLLLTLNFNQVNFSWQAAASSNHSHSFLVILSGAKRLVKVDFTVS